MDHLINHCLSNRSKNFHTCDKTGDQQGQHQHLEHSHQQLSREGEELDIAVGHVVGTQGETQDYTYSEGVCLEERRKGKLYYVAFKKSGINLFHIQKTWEQESTDKESRIYYFF